MVLADVRDYIATLGLADDENCYMGKMDTKPDKAIGCYILNRGGINSRTIGGYKTYGGYPVSLLIHWNKSPRQTEQAAQQLFDSIEALKDVEINDTKIKFARLLVEHPVDVGTDDNGIYEMVIEAELIYERR